MSEPISQRDLPDPSVLQQSSAQGGSDPTEPEIEYHGRLHTIAFLTACATFPLIFSGGLVTSHHAGLSVPDWPNSYGYNMFLFPPSMWVGQVLYEHTHRLMGTLVGVLAITLVLATWTLEQRRWVRWLSVGVLAAVIIQGVLGGLRVVWMNLDLAIIHGCVAQAFFCLAALMAIVTSRWWIEDAPNLTPPAEQARNGQWLVGIAAFAVTVTYMQLIAGAVMRHFEAGLAIPDLPLAYGRLLPPMTGMELDQANAMRGALSPPLPLVTLYQIHIHFVHRIGALIVLIATWWLAVSVVRRHGNQPALLRPATLLLVLILAQFVLGALTVLMRKPADVATAHVAVGALALVTSFTIFMRACRLYGPRHRGEVLDAPTAPLGGAHPAIN